MGQSPSKAADSSSEGPSYGTRLSATSIRLLTILPGSHDAPVEVRLKEHKFEPSNRCPRYDAISYVWGSPDEQAEIICNGLPIMVRPSLQWALRRIRHRWKLRTIWADALCINQLDKKERAIQVSIMGQIYSAAQTVYICLGDLHEAALGPEGPELMSAFATVLCRMAKYRPDQWSPVLKESRFAKVWLFLMLIHQHEWFRRAWVLQEVGLAKNPQILFDRWRFGYRVFIEATIWLREPGHGIKMSAGSLAHSKWLDWRQESELVATASRSAFELLYDSSCLNCQDPRDHVYGFLGHPLLRNIAKTEAFLRPDYEQEPGVLFLQLSEFFLRSGEMRMLGCIKHTPSSLRDGLPSWAIRWQSWNLDRSHKLSLPGARLARPTREWQASVNLNSPKPEFQGGVLSTRGVVIDKIEQVFEVWCLSDEDMLLSRSPDRARFSPVSFLQWLGGMPHVPASRELGSPEGNPIARKALTWDQESSLISTLGGGLISDEGVYEYKTEGVFTNSQAAIVKPDAQQPSHFGDLMQSMPAESNIQRFIHAIRKTTRSRAFAITENGHYVLGPLVTRVGDLCCVLQGFSVPAILRRDSFFDDAENTMHRFLGEAWSPTLVNGEAAQLVQLGDLQQQTLLIR